MSDNYALPFKLTAESVDDWLLAVDQLSHADKANRFNKVVTELNNAQAGANKLFPVLDKLTETFLALSNSFEHIATSENDSSEKTRKMSSFSIQLPKKLCLAYCKLSDDSSATKAQQAFCIYRAMQILCLLIKRNTLFYEVPDPSLWKKLAELYLKAQNGNFLSVDIEDKVAGLVCQPNIEAVLKHALLFYICNAYQYSPSDISDIFSAIAVLTQLMRLDSEPSDCTLCYWNPYSQLPPQSVNQEQREDQALYIDTSELIDYFENRADKLENYRVLVPAIKRLTAYAEIRRSVIPSTQRECGLIMGITLALKFLNVLTSRNRILELSGTIGDQLVSSNFELVPMANGENTFSILSAKILKGDMSLPVDKIKTFQTNNRTFCTAKIGSQTCSMDEPVILVYENQRPLFAVIRHMWADAGFKLKNILMEIIEGVVYPVEIDGNQGVILVPSFGKTELFLPPGSVLANYSVLFTVKMISDKIFRVDRFIESTAHFSRYQASAC